MMHMLAVTALMKTIVWQKKENQANVIEYYKHLKGINTVTV